jgi:hypothetical protein
MGGKVNQFLFVLKHFHDDLDIRENPFKITVDLNILI